MEIISSCGEEREENSFSDFVVRICLYFAGR